MSTRFPAFADAYPEGEHATRPLARLGVRLALSLHLVGMSLSRRREKEGPSQALSRPLRGAGAPHRGGSGGLSLAPDIRPDAPASVSNCCF